jgi:hypothetical protein
MAQVPRKLGKACACLQHSPSLPHFRNLEEVGSVGFPAALKVAFNWFEPYLHNL